MREVEDKPRGNRAISMVGIIPLCGQQYRERKLPWHPALLPVNEQISLIELAIAHCAYVGCDSIWIVVEDFLQEHFKKRIGDWVYDPIIKKEARLGLNRGLKRIAIYYVPESLADRDKRDSVSFQVIRGIEMARKVTGQISSFTIPDKYFVTFPYAIYDHEFLLNLRKEHIRDKRVMVEFGDKSIKTGNYMPFIMTYEDARACKNWVWYNAKHRKDTSQPKEEWQYGMYPTKELPESESYTGRWFGPDEVFQRFYNHEETKVFKLEWFYDASTFEGYREYMSSDNFINRLKKKVFKSRRWNSMSFDNEEFNK